MPKSMTQSQFIAHMAEVTRKAGYQVEKCEALTLVMQLNGGPFRARLNTAFSAYQNAPQRLADIEAAHLSVLKRVPPPPPPLSEEQAQKALIPVLQKTSWVTEANQSGATPLFTRPFVTGIVIAYVLDYPTHRAYFNQQMAETIMNEGAVPAEAIHEFALNNLRHEVAKYKVTTIGSFAETLISCESQEGYAAAMILLPEHMTAWKKKIAGRMLIGIPNRDFIIAFSDRHPAGIDGLGKQVLRDAGSRKNPLLSRLLVWEDGRASELNPLN